MSDQPQQANQAHQELADALSGIMTVVESHGTVAMFWMGEHAKARLAADDLQSEIYLLQEHIEELLNRDESEGLTALQAKLDVSEKALRASKKANVEQMQTQALMTRQIDLKKAHVSKLEEDLAKERTASQEKTDSYTKATVAQANQITNLEKQLSDLHVEIAAAKNAATVMSEKVAAPGQETAGDQGWMSIQNALLKENIRKIGTHLERVDRDWSENPDSALRALGHAHKLVEKSAAIGGKKS